MGLVTNGTHSSQMEIPNGNFPGFFVNGKRPRHQLPVGLIAPLVEHYTGVAEVMGLYPVQAQVSQVLKNSLYYCNDQSG